MKGYAKIKENTNIFSQKSKSNTEYPFLDQDSYLSNKETQENEQEPNIIVKVVDDNKVKNDLCLGKSEEKWDRESALGVENEGETKMGSVLRRNFSCKTSSFGYQKNGSNSNSSTSNIYNESGKIERQSSKRVVIQDAVKRVFSMRRCSSVNHGNGGSNFDRYCRIYDQSIDKNNVNDCNNDYDYDFDDDFGKNESMETRSKGQKKKNIDDCGKKHVGSKVVRACKRLFSR